MSRSEWRVANDKRVQSEIGRAHGLNSSHRTISYAVFCLKKKKKTSMRPRESDKQPGRPCRSNSPTYHTAPMTDHRPPLSTLFCACSHQVNGAAITRAT